MNNKDLSATILALACATVLSGTQAAEAHGGGGGFGGFGGGGHFGGFGGSSFAGSFGGHEGGFSGFHETGTGLGGREAMAGGAESKGGWFHHGLFGNHQRQSNNQNGAMANRGEGNREQSDGIRAQQGDGDRAQQAQQDREQQGDNIAHDDAHNPVANHTDNGNQPLNPRDNGGNQPLNPHNGGNQPLNPNNNGNHNIDNGNNNSYTQNNINATRNVNGYNGYNGNHPYHPYAAAGAMDYGYNHGYQNGYNNAYNNGYYYYPWATPFWPMPFVSGSINLGSDNSNNNNQQPPQQQPVIVQQQTAPATDNPDKAQAAGRNFADAFVGELQAIRAQRQAAAMNPAYNAQNPSIPTN